MHRRTISLFTTLCLLIPAQLAVYSFSATSADARQFVDIDTIKDVKSNHWAYGAIETIVQDLGIMKLKSPNMFMGDNIATRYEVADSFYDAAKKLEIISGLDLKINAQKGDIKLTDVDNEHKKAVESITNEYGIMQVISGNSFMGSKPISRYEIAFYLNTYLNLLEKTVAKNPRPVVNRAEKLNDVNDYDWAASAVKNIVDKYQIMRGYPDQTFRGNNTLTRYELVAILKKFIDYIDKNLIPIPKYIPEPTTSPVVQSTPKPTMTPEPVVTTFPSPMKRPLNIFDIGVGLEIKGASNTKTTDILSGPALNANFWFPKLGNARFGANINGSILGYSSVLSQFNNTNDLKRTLIGGTINWRALGADYLDDPSLTVGIGYEYLQWSGQGYNYSNHGPKAKALFEYPIIEWLSIFVDDQFFYAVTSNKTFTNDIIWKNELFLGINAPAFSSFSLQIGYKDTRYTMTGRSEIFGDIGGVALVKYRY